MRVGIVQKLRMGFEEVGRKGSYDPSIAKGDPTKSRLVQECITFKHLEQGESGVKPKSARTMHRLKMDKLMANLKLEIKRKYRDSQTQNSGEKSEVCFLFLCH